ncbi:MAG: tetraacyldisaccharide 4'-kinase [Candidatus Omnitrophica bacterium]|nr:tetraacyldisaccharide 4'-kinase [Candidatus Omnitrophota bacterium]
MRRYLYSLMTDQLNDPLSSFLKKLLFLLTVPYHLLLGCRKTLWRIGLYRRKKLPLRVISVGNITWGGTGKTPFVKWLVGQLLSRGEKVAVLTRGYRKLGEDVADEALELRSAFPDVPVWVGKDRVALAEKAISAHMDAVVLDDGFQYWHLERDLDIVLIDATNPFGNGRVLPRGILRERPSALKRADLLVLTRTDGEAEKSNRLERFLKGCAPETPLLFSAHRPRRFVEARTQEEVSFEQVRRERGIAFCGIGNPRSFEHLLERNGIHPLRSISFMDHHRYRREDLEQLDQTAASLGGSLLLTTGKDLERLKALRLFPSTRLLALEVELVMTKNEDELFRRLNALFSR